MNEKIPSMVKEWLRLAEMDLESAGFLFNLHRTPVEIICYHCQQSSEKYMKALILLSSLEPPATHNLDVLMQLCKNNNIASEVWGGITTEVIRLTAFGVKPRYPSPIPLVETDAKQAYKDASKVRDVVVGEILKIASRQNLSLFE